MRVLLVHAAYLLPDEKIADRAFTRQDWLIKVGNYISKTNRRKFLFHLIQRLQNLFGDVQIGRECNLAEIS
jgi:hypothetical protein